METAYKSSQNLKGDLERFRQQVERFKNGAISAAQWRAFRVPQGVYEQKTDGTHMLRVRFPGGVVQPSHLCTLAHVSRTYGNGVLHITSRQDIQIHAVKLDDLHPALVALAEGGLSTKGEGGNTVRNITACPFAGVCSDEIFDVTPYTSVLTEFLLQDPISFRLPRKYKIAFSGCRKDCAGCTVNDLGFLAQRRNGGIGFAVYAGGGMGARSRTADLLEPFVTPDKVPAIAEAVKRVFDKYGNRRDKHKARLRFLVEEIGFGKFKELYQQELKALHREALPQLEPSEPQQRTTPVPREPGPAAAGFKRWRRLNVQPQKQQGFNLVHIPLLLGDLPADKCVQLASIAARFGPGALRTTQQQNLLLRWVHDNELPQLHAQLQQLGLGDPLPPVLRNLVVCAGASTCRLGICLSRGLAQAIVKEAESFQGDLEALGPLRIHISGCPNACGRHPLADIGLFGAARRCNGRLVPHYIIQVGGSAGGPNCRPAHGDSAVPARDVPALVWRFLQEFHNSPHRPDFSAFMRNGGQALLSGLCREFADIPAIEEDRSFYCDWGSKELFSLAGRGPGECGAGLFDLIEVDLASAKEALQNGRLLNAVTLGARSLLVTRGQEAQSELEGLELFKKFFIDSGLVPSSLETLIEKARDHIKEDLPPAGFNPLEADVELLVDSVSTLYENMDSSLRFRPLEGVEEEKPAGAESPSADLQELKPDREEDFRGVACPLNYVKTKLVLEAMNPGEILSILVDEPGKRNVPESLSKDGHQVLSEIREGETWRILIRRKAT